VVVGLVGLSMRTVGGKLGRLAIAILVVDRTSSAALTARTYTLPFPPLVSAPLLTPLTGHCSRRLTLVATDLARGALVAVMAIPGLGWVCWRCWWWSWCRCSRWTAPPATRSCQTCCAGDW
jgi:hypothetical protein